LKIFSPAVLPEYSPAGGPRGDVTGDDLISLPAKSKNKFLKVKVNTQREEEKIVLK
jgi:hypothetical protein